MTVQLPAPIGAYMEASARLDAEAILDTFADDAVVSDENRTHRGRDALRAWILEAAIGNKVVPTPVSVTRDDEGCHVTAEVRGDFVGSPVMLTFRFVLEGDRIAKLAIQ